MISITRRKLLRALASAAGLGATLIALGSCGRGAGQSGTSPSPQSGSGMMGSATRADMSAYQEMFDRHTEIRRTVEEIPGGVRTTTESDDPAIAAQLQAHVSSMYGHLAHGQEVTCMSNSLPTLFRHANGYRRQLTLTAKGVSVSETSDNPSLTTAIRNHAREITGFVKDGMPAMMRGMMGG